MLHSTNGFPVARNELLPVEIVGILSTLVSEAEGVIFIAR